jgi:tungstate transport system permease protein
MDTILRALIDAIRLIAQLDPDLLDIVNLTLQVSGTALVLACLMGIPLGTVLGLTEFPGRRFIRLLITTGMGFPPVVVGLLVFLLLSRSGPLGELEWLFTPTAMITSQTILAFPLAAGLTASAVGEIPRGLVLQLRSLGATPWQERWAVLRQARRGVIAAVLAAFGRIISEVGSVMLVGGNIASRTRVLSTAIVLETRQGNFSLALSLGMILLGLALLVNTFLTRLEASRLTRRKL